jgi:hypothetical protein
VSVRKIFSKQKGKQTFFYSTQGFKVNQVFIKMNLQTVFALFGVFGGFRWVEGRGGDVTDAQIVEAYCQTMAGSYLHTQHRLETKCHTRVEIFKKRVRLMKQHLIFK